MVFAHDTEAALQAAVALVNTAEPPDTLTTVPELDAWYEEHAFTGRRDSDDAKRFGMIPAEADMSFEGWVEPKYLKQALSDLRLERYWPEYDADGKPKPANVTAR